jgi:hypothetical protein
MDVILMAFGQRHAIALAEFYGAGFAFKVNLAARALFLFV